MGQPLCCFSVKQDQKSLRAHFLLKGPWAYNTQIAQTIDPTMPASAHRVPSRALYTTKLSAANHQDHPNLRCK